MGVSASKEVRLAFKDARRYMALATALLDARDRDGAFEAAESAQHAAFDAKNLIANGGRYEPEANRSLNLREWVERMGNR